MKKTFTIFILLIPFILFSQGKNTSNISKFLSESERIFILKEGTDGHSVRGVEQDDITFFVRMPSTWTNESDKASRSGRLPSVRGVICIATWFVEEHSIIEKILTKDTAGYKYLIELADKHNLAVVSWSNFGGYDRIVSTDEMTKEQIESSNKRFNNILREWERGYSRLLNKYNLPTGDALMFGYSAGAQVAHRIALRKPKCFSGVHIHVNSTYDIPTRNAQKVIWLVTTGEVEYGYNSAERFYKSMLDLNYSVIFKAGENLGHSINDQIMNLSEEFFKYMVNFMPDPTDKNWKKPPVDKFYLLRKPIYIGDYLNHVAYPYDVAIKNIRDRKYMVALPTKPIAQAWGTIFEK